MKPLLPALMLLLLGATQLRAQTIIDLDRGRIRPLPAREAQHPDPMSKQRIAARDQALGATDSAAYAGCLRRAFSYLAADSLAAAQREFETALSLRPDAPGNHVLRHNIGRILSQRQQHRDAERIFSQLLLRHPQRADIRYDRALSRYHQQHYAAFLDDASRLIAATDSLPPAQLHRLYVAKIDAHHALHQTPQADEALAQFARRFPNDATAEKLTISRMLDNGQYEAAIARLDAALDATPNDVEHLRLRAAAHAARHHWDLARDDLDRAVSLAPHEAILYLHRAEALIHLDLRRAARKDLDRAAALGIDQERLKPLYDQL